MILTLQCLLRTGNNEVITFRGYIKGELPVCKMMEIVLFFS